MEKVAEVKTLIVHEMCPACEVGTMKIDRNAPVLTTYPPRYLHKCTKCGYSTHYTEQYPYTKSIQIEPLRNMTEEEKDVIE